MQKDLNENTQQNRTNKHFIHQVRILLKDWDIKVMSYVMLVIVMIAMIAATVAWFLYFKVVAVSNMSMTTADCEVLKVEVKQGTKQIGETEETNFVEVKEGEENTVLVDLDMPVFDNVETYEITVGDTVSGSGDNSGTDTQKKKVSKMAPGVYGSLTIRLTPLSKEINCYEITPEAMFKYIDAVNAVVLEDGTTSNVQVDSNVQIMEELAKGHILFFKERVAISNSSDGKIMIADNTVDITTHTHNQKYVFVDQISSDKPMIGNLTWNTENNTGNSTEVTLYWYWPYEYNNLSSDIQDSIKLDRLTSPTSAENDPRRNYFDMDKMQEIENKSASWNETQLYDYADTRIGTYVKSIQLHLEVKGYHATEQTPSGE